MSTFATSPKVTTSFLTTTITSAQATIYSTTLFSPTSPNLLSSTFTLPALQSSIAASSAVISCNPPCLAGYTCLLRNSESISTTSIKNRRRLLDNGTYYSNATNSTVPAQDGGPKFTITIGPSAAAPIAVPTSTVILSINIGNATSGICVAVSTNASLNGSLLLSPELLALAKSTTAGSSQPLLCFQVPDLLDNDNNKTYYWVFTVLLRIVVLKILRLILFFLSIDGLQW